MTLTTGELFAGYGGLGLAVSAVLGARVEWVAEVDRAATLVLGHRFPGIPNLGDVTRVDWHAVPRVDVLTGGSPCQDLSNAGRRAGMAEGTRSNLWVAMREAVAILRPSLVVWENVRGAYSAPAASALDNDPRLVGRARRRRADEPVLRALGRVLGDLADLGYVGGWHGVRASDVGAPHERPRVFVAAYARDRSTDLDPRALPRQQGPERRPGAPDDRRPRGRGRRPSPGPTDPRLDEWGPVAPAVARWEQVTGHRAPRLGDDLPRIAEWMMGLPAGWITDVPGVSPSAALSLCGNGVVPQQAAYALEVLLGDVVPLALEAAA